MKKTLFLFSILILGSCTSNTILKKPKNLIPKDTMVFLLTDLYLASVSFNEKNTKLETKVNYMPLVYNKYKIDSTRYKESNLYYITKVDEYDEIFKKVKSNLEKEKAILESIIKKQKDSLKANIPKLLDEKHQD